MVPNVFTQYTIMRKNKFVFLYSCLYSKIISKENILDLKVYDYTRLNANMNACPIYWQLTRQL